MDTHIHDPARRPLYPTPFQDSVNWNGRRAVWVGYGMLKLHVDDQGRTEAISLGDQRVPGVRFDRVRPDRRDPS